MEAESEDNIFLLSKTSKNKQNKLPNPNPNPDPNPYPNPNPGNGSKEKNKSSQSLLCEDSESISHDSHCHENNFSESENICTDIPSLAEVEEYCREKGLNIDARKFYDYYSANKWTSEGKKIRSWKALAHTWERYEQSTKNVRPPETEHRIDYSVLINRF